MERKFISIDALKKVLIPKEMKNVMGGSGLDCSNGTQCVSSGEIINCKCTDDAACQRAYGPGFKCQCY